MFSRSRNNSIIGAANTPSISDLSVSAGFCSAVARPHSVNSTDIMTFLLPKYLQTQSLPLRHDYLLRTAQWYHPFLKNTGFGGFLFPCWPKILFPDAPIFVINSATLPDTGAAAKNFL